MIWCMVPEIWSATDRIFCHFGPFGWKKWHIEVDAHLKTTLSIKRDHFLHDHMKCKTVIWFMVIFCDPTMPDIFADLQVFSVLYSAILICYSLWYRGQTSLIRWSDGIIHKLCNRKNNFMTLSYCWGSTI